MKLTDKIRQEFTNKLAGKNKIPDYFRKVADKLKDTDWEYPRKEDYMTNRGVMVFLNEDAYNEAVYVWENYRPRNK